MRTSKMREQLHAETHARMERAREAKASELRRLVEELKKLEK